MSKSSNKSKVECLKQFITTLKRKPKQIKEQEDDEKPNTRIQVKGMKKTYV